MRGRASAPLRGAADVSPDVLAVLVLPSLDDVTDDQSRGATCVWDDVPLKTDMAVDLGEQLSPLKGTAGRMRWMPRACPACVLERAKRARFAHATMCEQCADEAAPCEIGQGLSELVRRYSR